MIDKEYLIGKMLEQCKYLKETPTTRLTTGTIGCRYPR